MNLINYFYYVNHPTFLFPGIFVPFKNFIKIDQSNREIQGKKIFFLILKVVINSLIIEFFSRVTSIFSMFTAIDDAIQTFSTFSIVNFKTLKLNFYLF